jgi:hypothetical protein
MVVLTGRIPVLRLLFVRLCRLLIVGGVRRAVVIPVVRVPVMHLYLALQEHAATSIGQHAVPDRGPHARAGFAELGLELGRISRFDQLELIALGGHPTILRPLSRPVCNCFSTVDRSAALRDFLAEDRARTWYLPCTEGQTMAEVIHVFGPKIFLNGMPYTAQVIGAAAGHIWEGWIVFSSDDGTDVRRTGRETTQPNREALEYWATGLSGVYLEGALVRALQPPLARPAEASPVAFDYAVLEANNGVNGPDRPVLNPFAVAASGLGRLRQELGALRDWHLRKIARAYNLADESIDLDALSEAELVEVIVSGVRAA